MVADRRRLDSRSTIECGVHIGPRDLTGQTQFVHARAQGSEPPCPGAHVYSWCLREPCKFHSVAPTNVAMHERAQTSLACGDTHF
jgi:hypothetical protein